MVDSRHKTTGAAPLMSELVQIDAICDQYEQALKEGNSPPLADVLVGAPDRVRTVLLGEILLIEVYHGRAADAVLDGFKRAYPELSQELDEALARVEYRMTTRDSPQAATHISDVVLASESMLPPSRMFEIACPHCGSSVAVASDSRSSRVFCGTCHSTFSIADDAAEARGAAGLTTVGHFRLMSRLGVGGCGTVWKAHDAKLGRTVAVKIPRSGRLDRDEEERFLREARTVAQLVHPNIVSVHEIGHDDELSYIVSDYVRGVALSDWLTAKRPSTREAAKLLAKVADALHYAHEQGIVHRDLKPSNILMDAGGEPHITDFGLAKWESAEFSIAAESQVLGTPAYMSPEQARGESHRSDRRTDVYSLGVVLFQLLTGELPFRGNQEMLLHQIKYDAPPSPRKFDKNVPRDLETICLTCLEKPLASRYESARALSHDLRRFLRGEPIHARPVSPLVRGLRWCQRKPAAAAALGLIVFIAIAGPILAAYQASLRRQAEEERQASDRLRREAQALAQEVVGMRADDGRAASNRSPIQFTMPLVSDRLAAAALENGLRMLRSTAGATITNQQRAKLHVAVGVLAARQGRFETAIEYFGQAIDELGTLWDVTPNAPHFLAAVAFCEECLGQLYAALGDMEHSLQYQEQAIHKWHRLVEDHPDEAAYRRSLAESLLRLSLGQSLAGYGAVALDNVRQSKLMVDQLADIGIEDPEQLYLVACELADSPPFLDDNWHESAQSGQDVDTASERQKPAE